MARTMRGERGSTFEYRSRRFPYPLCPGRYAKKITHRRERREAKASLRRERQRLAA